MAFFGERQTYETALQSLKARRIVLASSTSFGIQSVGDDDYGRYEEEVGLFPQDRRLLHGVSWIIKRSGLRQRAHRWLTFNQVGSVWVYHWTNRPDGIRFSFGLSGFNFQGAGLGISMDTSEHLNHQRSLDHQEPDRYWTCLGEFRLFGPFYRTSYASDLAGHLAGALGLPCDTTPRRQPRAGQIASPSEPEEFEPPPRDEPPSNAEPLPPTPKPKAESRPPEPRAIPRLADDPGLEPEPEEAPTPKAEPTGKPRSLPRPPSYRQMRADPSDKKKR
ncbi:hypothetical protein DYH09_22785 [bacterium CPR1]|nr:hypothetical protein [bacterium CPR1]